jgi:hypothetical protein
MTTALFPTKSTTFARDGQYFQASNPTPGTGIASASAPTAYSALAPFLLLNNADPVKSITLDYLRLRCTAAGTNGTALHWAHAIDGVNPSKYTSGGSVSGAGGTLLIVNPNMGSGQASSAILYAGAVVCLGLSSAGRLLSHGNLRVVKPVIGDSYLWTFGGDMDGGISSTPAMEGTTVANVTVPTCPVIIGPTQWWAFHLWLPSQSVASSYEFELGYIEA